MLARFIFILSITISFSVKAVIVDQGRITLDTGTNLQWLDPIETAGLLASEVLNRTSQGGSLEGWRYATVSELDRLITNFGYVAINDNCPYGNNHCDGGIGFDAENLVVEKMIKTLGDTWAHVLDEENWGNYFGPNGAGYTKGIIDSGSLFGTGYFAIITDQEYYRKSTDALSVDKEDTVKSLFTGVNINSHDDVGSFLVRPVPLPAAGWFLLIGISSILGLSYRPKKG